LSCPTELEHEIAIGFITPIIEAFMADNVSGDYQQSRLVEAFSIAPQILRFRFRAR